MKYVIAFYKNILKEQDNSVPFGVVITDGEKITYDFDTSKVREKAIKKISDSFDPLVFEHFKDTFNDGFIKGGIAITTSDNGKQRVIPVNSEEFLNYLTRNSQGVYQYTKPKAAESDDSEALLDTLMRLHVRQS